MVVRKRQFQRDIEESIPWYCTSCGACTLRCPRDVKPSEVIIDIRSAFVEEGQIPVSLQKALENTFVQKNPWGRSRAKRGSWAEKAGPPPHISETKSKRLLFTCCIQAYDPRCMVIPVNVAALLERAGVEFGVLGEEEACCGNEIRRIGETGLFEELREENRATFKEYGVREIIALSPHCMNALKKEYGDLGDQGLPLHGGPCGPDRGGEAEDRGEVRKEGDLPRPLLPGQAKRCFRQPRSCCAPSRVWSSSNSARSRETSLCCEGGGGRMFFEVEGTTALRNAEVRVLEAIEKGADIIATAVLSAS